MSLAPGPVLAPLGGGPGVSVGVSPGATGIQVAPGDPGSLLASSSELARLGQMLEDHSSTVLETAGSLAPSWLGQASGAYQQLSSIVSAHFRAAAGTSRTAAASLRRYSAELDRCQREGMQAVTHAEACLKEIHDQTARLAAAQAAAGAAQGALNTARAQATTAGAAGPLGVPLAAAADAQASIEQGRLTSAETEIQAARRALTHAHEDLTMWQGRGRRAWEEAQSAADQASGSLEALTIAAPPLAGVAALPLLSATPPFALPGEAGCPTSPGTPVEDPLFPGLLADPIPERLPTGESLPGIEPVLGGGLIADPIPERLPTGESLPGIEPVLGGGLIADPAPAPCPRHQVDDTGGGTGEGQSSGGGLGDLYDGGKVPSEAELHGYAQGQGWQLQPSPTGPPKYVDGNGVPRLTIKSGSARTPGSEGPHIEVRDPSGQRTDPFGNPVLRRSPGNHYPYTP
ncbi:MAG TPA: hypothetical protein VG186_13945 [Solirubrobacteraceae bacterium]|nr:hypothetical protein [Solirubrobacteraceae bacterium]